LNAVSVFTTESPSAQALHLAGFGALETDGAVLEIEVEPSELERFTEPKPLAREEAVQHARRERDLRDASRRLSSFGYR
jgi:hypothetical protein